MNKIAENKFVVVYYFYIIISLGILKLFTYFNDIRINSLLEYTVIFINVLLVISLVISTILIIWQVNLKQFNNLKAIDNPMQIQLAIGKTVGFILLTIVIYLLTSYIYFQIDLSFLLELEAYYYIGILFVIMPLIQVFLYSGMHKHSNKVFINKLAIFYAILMVAILFLAGFAYYQRYFTYGGLILSLSIIVYTLSLINYASESSKKILLVSILKTMFVAILVIFLTDNQPRNYDYYMETDNYEELIPITKEETFEDSKYGTVTKYKQDTMETYHFNYEGYSYSYEIESPVSISIKISNPQTIEAVDVYYSSNPDSLSIYGITKNNDNEFNNCQENNSYETLINDSACLNSSNLKVVDDLVKNNPWNNK